MLQQVRKVFPFKLFHSTLKYCLKVILHKLKNLLCSHSSFLLPTLCTYYVLGCKAAPLNTSSLPSALSQPSGRRQVCKCTITGQPKGRTNSSASMSTKEATAATFR